MDEKPIRFKRSIDTQQVLKRLLELEKGGPGVTVDELCRLVGDENLYRDRRYIIASARELAEDSANMNLEWKDGIIRALSDQETAQLGYVRKVRRAADRGMLKSSRIEDFDGLSRDDKVTITVSRTILTLVKMQTAHKALKQLESRVKEHGESLQLETQLKEFMK